MISAHLYPASDMAGEPPRPAPVTVCSDLVAASERAAVEARKPKPAPRPAPKPPGPVIAKDYAASGCVVDPVAQRIEELVIRRLRAARKTELLIEP